jgi:hypothetical protein
VGDPRGDVCWGLIDMLLSRCGIRRGGHVWGKYNFHFDDQDLWIEFQCDINHPGESWLRLMYQICDYWTGEPHDIDELIYLVATHPPFGGLRWWFVCPRTNRRGRMLHLPLGARRFASRGAYRLVYASQRGTAVDRAHRGQAKIKARLIGDRDPRAGERVGRHVHNTLGLTSTTLADF